MKIAVLNLKGGTGKTTTAVFLATGLARSGRTLLVDADPQASALSWSEAAGDLPFVTIGLPVRDVHRRLAEVGEGYAHVVVDTPPGDTAIVRSAALAVDIAVVPIAPGLIELDRLRPTLELLAEVEGTNAVRVQVVLTKVRRGTRSAEAARQVLAELGLPVMEAQIPLLEAYAGSFGMAPASLREYEDLLAELVQEAAAA